MTAPQASLTIRNINFLNTGLIVVSLILAYIIPFKLFLFSLAVLGPLHYLTEINWLNTRKYWVSDINWLWPGVIVVAGIVAPKLLVLLQPNATGTLGKITLFLSSISTGLLFISLAWSAVLVLVKNRKWRIISAVACLVLAFPLNSISLYTVIFGLLLPTLVHVFFFTLLFMLYGAKKDGDWTGYIPVYMMIAVPMLIALFDVNPNSYAFSEAIKSKFISTGFHTVIAQLGKFLGILDGKSFYFYEKTELKLQVFIAFAYVYHYLNWFTKTSIIGWHSNLQGKRAKTLIILWGLMVAAFGYSYEVGFICALFFSFLHVILEFPLNIVSIKGILNTKN